jgi:4-hydroxybenzoate polyprenyltransferase
MTKIREPLGEATRQLFWASRPVSWINTAFPFGAAYFVSTGRLDEIFWIGTLFFLIPYNVLMYGINDVFDYESDLRNPRKGGIEGALLSKRWHRHTVWASVFVCIPFLAYLVWSAPWAAGWLALFIFTVVAYSAPVLRFKERPVLDSITSASHFVGPMIFGLAVAKADLLQPAILATIAAFTLWGMASHAFGAVQDVRADREAGISSIATFFGARLTTRLSLLAYAASGILVIAAGGIEELAAIAAVPYMAVVAPFWFITDETCEQANRGWRRFIWLNFFAGTVVTLLLNYAIQSDLLG